MKLYFEFDCLDSPIFAPSTENRSRAYMRDATSHWMQIFPIPVNIYMRHCVLQALSVRFLIVSYAWMSVRGWLRSDGQKLTKKLLTNSLINLF